MKILTFARMLSVKKDIDPVYEIPFLDAFRGNFDKIRFVYAYLLFYDVGVALALSRLDTEWGTLEFVQQVSLFALTKRSRRGVERRHFRAKHAEWTATAGRSVYSEFYDCTVSHHSWKNSISALKKLPSFGDWLAFKATDMLERTNLVHAYKNSDDECLATWYGVPEEGWSIIKVQENYNNKREFLSDILQLKLRLPGGGFRQIFNMQEIETLCCKYKSHTNGRYEPGNDVKHVMNQMCAFKLLDTDLGPLIPQQRSLIEYVRSLKDEAQKHFN
jgi:hypothetical protein